jgi:hypothetical protein
MTNLLLPDLKSTPPHPQCPKGFLPLYSVRRIKKPVLPVSKVHKANDKMKIWSHKFRSLVIFLQFKCENWCFLSSVSEDIPGLPLGPEDFRYRLSSVELSCVEELSWSTQHAGKEGKLSGGSCSCRSISLDEEGGTPGPVIFLDHFASCDFSSALKS